MTWIPRSTYSRGRVVFKAACGNSTSYAAANIDAKALGRYLQQSTVLELPSKARQAILRRLESAVGPKGPGNTQPGGHHGVRKTPGRGRFPGGVGLRDHPRPDLPHGRIVQWG